MMLTVWGVCPADAHDAGGLASLCAKYAQLMLMMLAVWGFASKVRPADAHDLAVWRHCVRSTPS